MKKSNTTRLQMKHFALVLLMAMGSASLGAYAAQGGGGGGGGGSGGGSMTPPDYGDLFVLLRDADGIPILTNPIDKCQQPLAAPGITLPAVGDIPECVPASESESCVIPVDPATCAVVLGYETYTQEIEFGRTNVARAPASMLETQLEDALIRLSTADCVTLDPAGRMVTSTVAGDLVTSAAIDSPLQNLAIYKQLMLKGYLGADALPLALPGNPLDTAARALGAASDKAGKVSVDMVVYLNQILGLTDTAVSTYLPKKCITVREEVMGIVQPVQKCFLNYGADEGAGNYAYDRGANFRSLPSPAYLPPPPTSPKTGWFEYLQDLGTVPPTFGIADGPILYTVPQLNAARDLTASSIGGFAQAADDARATIDFMHSWPVPGDYPTAIACTASANIQYDLSINDVSGLQVPVRMVAGTEGREFTLTVANAGPDAATGNVELTAVDSNGDSLATFPRKFDFTLAPGASQSWTELFSIDYATTITWTATITAPFDVNPTNNSVTAFTEVTGTGGGGGRKGGIR